MLSVHPVRGKGCAVTAPTHSLFKANNKCHLRLLKKGVITNFMSQVGNDIPMSYAVMTTFLLQRLMVEKGSLTVPLLQDLAIVIPKACIVFCMVELVKRRGQNQAKSKHFGF